MSATSGTSRAIEFRMSEAHTAQHWHRWATGFGSCPAITRQPIRCASSASDSGAGTSKTPCLR